MKLIERMKIDHIGYAVKKIDRAMSFFEKLGFCFEPIIDDMERNIRIAFGEKDGYRIEVICPRNKEKESPVDAYLSSVGSTPYHICYQTEDLNTEVESLKQQGFKVIIEPKPALAFGGKRVVFMMSLGFGLMEIVEV